MSRLRDDLQDNPRDSLAEYALGTLPPAERAEVEAYLTDSEDARAELRELQSSLEALTEALPATEPRAEVWDAVQAQLGAERPNTAPETVATDPAVTVFRPRPRRWRDLSRSGWPLAACLGSFG